jgi:hypothetical protein
MTRVLHLLLAMGLMALTLPLRPAVAAPDATAIIRDSDAAMKPQTEKTSYRMTLLNADGTVEQVRTFITYFHRGKGEERTLQKFLSPPVLAETGLLIVESGQPDTDIWLYLPTTRRIRRIAGQDKSNRYMGTEFAFEDFEDYRIPYYRFDLATEKRDPNGRDCWVIDATATAPSQVSATGYAKKQYWIEKKTLYPVRIEYYAKDQRLEKVFSVQNLRPLGRYWRPEREEIHNVRTGKITKLEIQSNEIDIPLDERYVAQRYLRGD